MRHNVFSIVSVILITLLNLYYCGPNPVNPATDPEKADIKLFVEAGSSIYVNEGESREIGLDLSYPRHFKSINITSDCGDLDTIVAFDSARSFDTIFFTPVFSTPGKCPITATALYFDKNRNEKLSRLEFSVYPGTAGIEYTSIPAARYSPIRNVDTLLFITKTKGSAAAREYAVTSQPAIDPSQLYLLPGATNDSARVVFNPAVADSYTISLAATVQVSAATPVKATATVGIRVFKDLSPAFVDAPETIAAGKADTLRFAVDNNRPDKLTIRLVTEKPLDPSIFTLLPSGADSVVIAVAAPATIAAGTMRIGIRTGNDILFDTAWFPVTFTEKDTSSTAVLSVIVTPIYTVSFNVDGGTAVSAQSVKQGEKAAKPATNPQKEGFEFAGWYTSETFATEFDFAAQAITADRTVFAKWIQVFMVTYDKNGATSGDVPVDSGKYRSGEFATVLGTAGSLKRNGYDFNGWNTSSDGTGVAKVSGEVITIGSVSVVLYAMWKRQQCTVVFDGQGAATPANPATKPVDISAAIGTLPTEPQKKSYVFDGWFTGTNGSGTKISAATTFSENDTVYAKWVIKDVDGNVYTEVKIGEQVWMVENLKVTRYTTGVSIPEVKDSAEWVNRTSGAFCWYDNDPTKKEPYGALYNWYAVNTGILAPKGWHFPSDMEWTFLEEYLVANGYNYDNIIVTIQVL